MPFADFNLPIASCLFTLTLRFLPFAVGLISSAYCFTLPPVQAMNEERGGGGLHHLHSQLAVINAGGNQLSMISA